MDIILVPGFWLDGSSWDEVVPALQQAGQRTHALTLPGMESREQGHPYVRELAKIRDVSYVDLPTGHWPQFTRPRELGQAILASIGPA
jgi:hypothetical protein